MTIKCLADDYIVKEKDKKFYVYNELYEGSLKSLFWASIVGLLLPDASDYYIPICVEIEKTHNEVTVGKKLDVFGTNDFKYFIAKHQYEKWKRTYKIAIQLLVIMCILINFAMGYLLFKSAFKLAMVVCSLCFLLLSLGAVIKLYRSNAKRIKHEIIDINF